MAALYGGRWKNLGNISGGGQGIVVKVEDSTGKLPGTYALKRLINSDDESRLTRFGREIATLQKLNHPNILKIVDQDLSDEKPYFVAEHCARGSLKDIGTSRFAGNIAATVSILLPIISGLAEAHKNQVIHRDIKPANILFRDDETPVLADFGICHVDDGYSLTSTNEGVGSQELYCARVRGGW